MPKLTDFYKNKIDDRCDQSLILDKFDPQNRKGICLAFSLMWLKEYCDNYNELDAPNEALHRIKNPLTIRDIVRIQNDLAAGRRINVRNVLEQFDFSASTRIISSDTDSLTESIKQLLTEDGNGQYALVLLILEFQNDVNKHAIGIIRSSEDQIYLFDPNMGVINFTDDELGKIMGLICDKYNTETDPLKGFMAYGVARD